MQSPEPAEKGRSAFAAAFFSALQPGLGQAYLGRWARGLVWATPTILLVAFAAGVVRHDGLVDTVAHFTAPSWQIGLLVGLFIDFLYRAASAIDAFRVARRRQQEGRSRGAMSSASGAGLIAVVLVMVLAHVAIAQPVYGVYSGLHDFNGGDTRTIDPNASYDPAIESSLPSFAPTPTNVPGETAAPTDTPGPTPTQGAFDFKKQVNILLIGADAGRANNNSYLTDTMIVMSIDPPTGRVALISMPRDTVGVPLPQGIPAYNAYGGAYGCGTCKINTLYTIARLRPDLFPGSNAQRGYSALMGALGTAYGLNIQYYVAVDLAGFPDVIDTLGGVTIDVQVPVYDDQYPANAGQGATKLYIPPGIQYMDGSTALAYARSRHATSDFDRAARQQRVIASIRAQTDLSTLLAPGVINSLFNELKSSIRTNIPPELFPQFIGLAQQIDFTRRVSLVLTPPTFSQICYPCPPSGLYELKANVPAIRHAVQNVFNTDPAVEAQRQKISSEAAAVQVLNGTTQTNSISTRVADALTTYGIDAAVPPVNGGLADRQDYTSTVITAWNGAQDDNPTTTDVLQKLFHTTVVTADDANQTTLVDFSVVVGSQTAVPPDSP